MSKQQTVQQGKKLKIVNDQISQVFTDVEDIKQQIQQQGQAINDNSVTLTKIKSPPTFPNNDQVAFYDSVTKTKYWKKVSEITQKDGAQSTITVQQIDKPYTRDKHQIVMYNKDDKGNKWAKLEDIPFPGQSIPYNSVSLTQLKSPVQYVDEDQIAFWDSENGENIWKKVSQLNIDDINQDGTIGPSKFETVIGASSNKIHVFSHIDTEWQLQDLPDAGDQVLPVGGEDGDILQRDGVNKWGKITDSNIQEDTLELIKLRKPATALNNKTILFNKTLNKVDWEDVSDNIQAQYKIKNTDQIHDSQGEDYKQIEMIGFQLEQDTNDEVQFTELQSKNLVKINKENVDKRTRPLLLAGDELMRNPKQNENLSILFGVNQEYKTGDEYEKQEEHQYFYLGYVDPSQFNQRNAWLSPSKIKYDNYSALAICFLIPEQVKLNKIEELAPLYRDQATLGIIETSYGPDNINYTGNLYWSGRDVTYGKLYPPINWNHSDFDSYNLDTNAYPFPQYLRTNQSFTPENMKYNKKYHNLSIGDQGLLYYARENKTKILLSLGGAGAGYGFTVIAQYPEKRETFKKCIIFWMNEMEADGVDFDWEFPQSTSEKTYFTNLSFDIFDALTEVWEKRKLLDPNAPRPVLTGAFSGDTYVRMDFIDWVAIKNIYFKFGIMTYDLYGGNCDSNYHAQLYTHASDPGEGSEQWKQYYSADKAVTKLLGLGIDAKQIMIGCAFYGRSWVQPSNQIYTPRIDNMNPNGAVNYFKEVENSKVLGGADGWPQFFYISHQIHTQQVNEEYSTDSQSAHIVTMNVVSVENNNYVISSFDNTQSVTEKCKYIVDKNLGGVISWTILGNYVVKDQLSNQFLDLNTSGSYSISTPLDDAINDTFQTYDKHSALLLLNPTMEQDANRFKVLAAIDIDGNFNTENMLSTSDTKYKTSLKIKKPDNKYLQRILKTNIYSYMLLSDTSRTHIGCLAQNVQQLFNGNCTNQKKHPRGFVCSEQLCSCKRAPKKCSVNYNEILCYFILGFQSFYQEHIQQKQNMNMLQAENKILKKQIQLNESQIDGLIRQSRQQQIQYNSIMKQQTEILKLLQKK